MSAHRVLSLLIFSMAAAARVLFSQILVSGTITDNGGEYLGNGAEPVSGATVMIIDQGDTCRRFSAVTDNTGWYEISICESSVEDHNSIQPDFTLFQNYPNPFNPSTVISFHLAEPAHVTLSIYNITGQKVNTLIDCWKPAGSGRIIWNGTDGHGRGVPSGVYIYTLKTGRSRAQKKMLLADGCAGLLPSAPCSRGSTGKPLSGIYTIRISGPDNAPVEQEDMEITQDTELDFSVCRTVTDIDGNVYRTVKIGDQWWMAENLKVSRYRNGDDIANVSSCEDWIALTKGSLCAYGSREAAADTFGYLYNWYALKDSRNCAPVPWHVPTNAEWQVLTDFLGGNDVAGGKLKEAGTEHWFSNIGGTNISGFTALPGGFRDTSDEDIYLSAFFWTGSENDNDTAWRRGIYCCSAVLNSNHPPKYRGYSVRLIRDEE